jgi:hypothetical protein
MRLPEALIYVETEVKLTAAKWRLVEYVVQQVGQAWQMHQIGCHLSAQHMWSREERSIAQVSREMLTHALLKTTTAKGNMHMCCAHSHPGLTAPCTLFDGADPGLGRRQEQPAAEGTCKSAAYNAMGLNANADHALLLAVPQRSGLSCGLLGALAVQVAPTFC